jgi:uncharacterized membrane protein
MNYSGEFLVGVTTLPIAIIYTILVLGILESAEETQLFVIHGIGLSNNLKPVAILPNGSSSHE